MTMRKFRERRLAVAFGLAVALAACDQPVQVHGYIPDPENVQKIEAGVHTREDILSLLGTPSTVSTFDDDRWYYIGQKSTQFAYQLPDIFERSIIEVDFDKTGFVTATRMYDLKDGREVVPVARETPTEGRSFTVLQQLLGNMGRLPSTDNGSVINKMPGP